MQASAYVGRIGGLAFALGVGVLPFICAGSASAAPTESGTGSSRPVSTASTPQAGRATKRIPASTPSRVVALSTPSAAATPTPTTTTTTTTTTTQPTPTASKATPAHASIKNTATGGGLFSALFNESPTLRPRQNAQVGARITGSLDAADADSSPLDITVTTAPTRGTLNIDNDGGYTYTADPSFEITGTTDTFTVEISDADAGFHIHGLMGLLNMLTFGLIGEAGHTTRATISLTIASFARPNTSPTGGATVGLPDSSGIVTGTVSGTDLDGDALTYSAPALTTKGSLTLSTSAGTFTYTPTDAARHAASADSASADDKTDSFTVTIADGKGGSTAVPVSVAIRAANTAPTKRSVTVGISDSDSGTVTGSVTGVDADGDTLTFSGSTTTPKGTVVVTTNGSFTYTPTPEARHALDRTDSFTVTINDGHGSTVAVPVSIAIRGSNAAPVAGSVTQSTNSVSGVVTGKATAADDDGDDLAFSGTATTSKGAVVVNSDGTFTFTPTAAARHASSAVTATAGQKSDTFTIVVTDGHGGSATIPVTVAISSANASPVKDSTTVDNPDLLSGMVSGSVSAVDADGDALTFAGSGSTVKGEVVINANGSFTYTPTADARHLAAALTASAADKVDTFTVTITDGHGSTVSVPVSVTINGANSAPIAGTATVTSHNTDNGAVVGVVAAIDPDGDALTYSGSTTTAKGTVIVSSDGSYSYTPTLAARQAAAHVNATAATKSDNFIVTVTDGHGSATAVAVTVPIGPANALPVAGVPTINSPTGATGTVTGRVTATDADGNSLTYGGSTTTSKGVVTVNGDGTFSYTPTVAARHLAAAQNATAAQRSDAFTVTIADGQGGVAAVPITVTISAHNTSPVAETNQVGASHAATGVVSGTVTASDSDGDSLTYSGSAATSKGSVVVNSTGTFTYTPTAAARHAAAAENAAPDDLVDHFTVTIADGHGGSVAVPVSVTIGPSNSIPVSSRTTIGTPDAATGSITGRVVATDSDSDQLTYGGSTTTIKGSVVVNSDGTFTYTPAAAARHALTAPGATSADRTDAFNVTVTDDHGALVAIPVSVTITASNAVPVATSPVVGIPDGSTGVVAGRIVVTDADGDQLTYSAPGNTASGALTLNPDGTFSYLPTAASRHLASSVTATSAQKRDSFTVTVSDGHGGSVTVPVSVNIGSSNAAPVFGTPSTGSPGANGTITGWVTATDTDGDTLTYSGTTSTPKGAVTVNTNGTFSYTPAPAARHAASANTATAADKSDSFTITVTDAHGGTVSLPVSVVVSPANTGPASGTTTLAVSDGIVTGRINGFDADGDTLSYGGSTTTAEGSVTINSDGTFTYTPTATARHAASALNATVDQLADTFTATIADGHGAFTSAVVTVPIAPSNSTPGGANTTVGSPADANGAVLGRVSFTDPDGDTLTYSGSTSTAKGTVSVNTDGTYSYTPSAAARHNAAAYSATTADKTDTFAVTVSDGHGGTQTIHVTVPVSGSNSAPTHGVATVGNADSSTGVVTGSISGVDSNGDTLTYSGTSSTPNGTVTVSTNGNFSYTPTASARHAAAADTATTASKTDIFTVTIDDGHGGLLAVPVTVPIAASNSNPVAGQSTTNPPNSSGAVTGTVTATDSDGDTLNYSSTVTTTKGTVVVNSTGTYTYTPTAAARHAAAASTATSTQTTDQFVLVITDGHGGSTPVSITVAISPANTDPTTGSPTTTQPNLNTGVVTGYFSATDADGDTLTYSGSATTAKGAVTVNSNGTFTYTPTTAARNASSAETASAADKSDSFTVSIDDGHGGSASIVVNVSLDRANTAPIAAAPSMGSPNLAGSTNGSITATDAEGDSLTYSGTTSTVKGTVTVNPDGTFTYTPTATARHNAAALTATTAEKSDTFAITISDGHGGRTTVPVSITVSPTNTTPTISPVTASSGPVITGALNATDPDGDALTYSVVTHSATTPAKGAIVLNSDGSFTYTPTAAAQHAASALAATEADTTDTFSITVTDGHGGASTAAITVSITPANNAPQTGSTTTTTDSAAGTVAGQISFTDADGDVLTYSGSNTTANGTVVVNLNGTYVYTATTAARHAAASATATSAQKTDTFVVTATDAHGGTVSAPITVTIPPANTAPLPISPTVTAPNNSTGVVTGTATATDADNDPLTYTGSTTTAKGTVTVASDGSFSYTPTFVARHAASSASSTPQDQTDTFAITVSDGYGGVTTIAVTVAVGPTNNAPEARISTINAADGSTGIITGRITGTDSDSDTLTYGGTSSASNGSVTVDADGTFTYTPTASARHAAAALSATPAQKADTFTVTISDGHGGTTAVPVTVTISPTNSAPVAGTSTVTAPDNTSSIVTGRLVVTDADADILTFSGTGVTPNGSLIVNSDGTFTYTPTDSARHAASALTAGSAEKTDTFLITVIDGHGASITIPITVNIVATNAAPVAGTPVMAAPVAATGVVTGTLSGTDSDGDTLTYSGSTTTAKGTVVVAPSGTFTYTPTAAARTAAAAENATAADKLDTFIVTITDSHGGVITVPVAVVVAAAPATVSFEFVYGTGSQYWTADAQAALQRAADILSSTIVVTRPVTLTYTLVGTNNPNTGYLATAYAYFSSGAAGYYDTVVQKKVITGIDSNGSAADGLVYWNFGYNYGYGDAGTITGARYDFTGVALHELLHTFGFISGIGDPSNPDTNWTSYDNFLVTSTGTKIIGNNYVFDPTYYTNLTGSNSGVYFGGTNAVAAYGGPVPLYTPGTWSSGSSLSHLDERNLDGRDQIMNAWIYYGTSPRTVDAVEAGILKDLGYTVNSGGTSAFAFAGFGMLSRWLRKRKRR